MSLKETQEVLKSLGRLGGLLLFAIVIAKFLNFWEDWTIYILYFSLLLILAGTIHIYSAAKTFKNIFGTIGGLAILLWILLAVFHVTILPLTATQLFWTAVFALAARILMFIDHE